MNKTDCYKCNREPSAECGECPVWLADEEVSEKERIAFQQGAKSFVEHQLAKHDTDLLDKVSRRFHSRILFRELTRAELMNIFDDIIAELKANAQEGDRE